MRTIFASAGVLFVASLFVEASGQSIHPVFSQGFQDGEWRMVCADISEITATPSWEPSSLLEPTVSVAKASSLASNWLNENGYTNGWYIDEIALKRIVQSPPSTPSHWYWLITVRPEIPHAVLTDESVKLGEFLEDPDNREFWIGILMNERVVGPTIVQPEHTVPKNAQYSGPPDFPDCP